MSFYNFFIMLNFEYNSATDFFECFVLTFWQVEIQIYGRCNHRNNKQNKIGKRLSNCFSNWPINCQNYCSPITEFVESLFKRKCRLILFKNAHFVLFFFKYYFITVSYISISQQNLSAIKTDILRIKCRKQIKLSVTNISSYCFYQSSIA